MKERTSSDALAVIRTDHDAAPISCTVCNLSEGGAKLMIEESEPLPAQFMLFLRPSSPVGRRCQTIWQLGNKVGVRFVAVAESGGHRGSGVWAPQ